MKNSQAFVFSLIQDIPYATQSDAQKLDLYLPTTNSLNYPVIVWIHPGGFFDGDKDGHSINDPLSRTNMIQLVNPMLLRNYAVASINYRLSHEVPFPHVIYDIKTAVRWVKANGEKYWLDPNKVAAWGSSAGGYLAAMLATTGDVRELEDFSTGNSAISSRITAAVDWYGDRKSVV
jgi:acetyl esterase/lipase